MEHAFGRSSRWSVGLEEELFVVDAATLAPRAADPLLADERTKPELYRAVLETVTGVCASAAEAAEAALAARRDLARRAADDGLALLAASTHPLASLTGNELTDAPRYREMADRLGPAAAVQFACGLHVHVGVDSPEACWTALEGVLPWLPVWLAASASSPYAEGRETGLASTRADLLGRMPRSGCPPAFGSYAAWAAWAERLRRLGVLADPTRLWWDARPHPAHGTLELRIPDQPTDPALVGAFAALGQALVASATAGPPADRGVYAENRWAALRFGGAARLVHPAGDRLASVPELLDELVERVLPTARALGSDALLEPLAALGRRTQAARQLATGRAHGVEAAARKLLLPGI
ncbi:MAG: YbdK family carboxylate-amine ligase [Thermoleophilia bacterium]